MVKNSKHLLAQCVHHGAEGRALIVFTLRCGCLRWVQLLGAGLAAVAVSVVVAVNAVALIRELAQMDFLTIRG